MGIARPIYLLSKAPYAGVNHIPIIHINALHVSLDITQYDLMVVTSKEAINALNRSGVDWKKLEVIAISEPTAAHVRSQGAKVVAVGKGYGDSLYELIRAHYASHKMLFPAASILASDFDARLRQAGIEIDTVPVYETSCRDSDTPIPENAVLAFSAPSTVKCFMKRYDFLSSHNVVVIGKSTEAALPLHVKAKLPKVASIEALVSLAKSVANQF